MCQSCMDGHSFPTNRSLRRTAPFLHMQAEPDIEYSMLHDCCSRSPSDLRGIPLRTQLLAPISVNVACQHILIWRDTEANDPRRLPAARPARGVRKAPHSPSRGRHSVGAPAASPVLRRRCAGACVCIPSRQLSPPFCFFCLPKHAWRIVSERKRGKKKKAMTPLVAVLQCKSPALLRMLCG